MSNSKSLSMTEAAADEGVTRATLYKEIAAGHLKTYTIRSRRKIDAAEWERY